MLSLAQVLQVGPSLIFLLESAGALPYLLDMSKRLGPKHLAALKILATGATLPAKAGVRGLWFAGLAEYVDGTNLRITDAGRAALAEQG